jgi:ferrous iron transport protein B
MNRFFGLPFFLAIMYITFWTTIVLGGILTLFFEALIQLPFLYISQFVENQLVTLMLSGLNIGLKTLASFIAPLFILYFMLGLLEQTGYMQRAALVIDRLMQYLKLPGQSFVPIIVGFGCNVPAIMSSRTLDYERDRIQTILMSPFMSCSARLAIFTVFANSFFGVAGYQIIFALYLFGFFIAIITGLVVRFSMGTTQSSPLIQELVPYNFPSIKELCAVAWLRVQSFLSKAAIVILPITFMIHCFVHSGLILNQSSQSMIVKIFEPIGLQSRDWPAALSLISGLLAKEVVIGTLEAFTTVQVPTEKEIQSLSTIAQREFSEVYDNLKNVSLIPSDSAAEIIPKTSLEGLFANQYAAVSYLIFVLLYFPCISVTTAIARESKSFWAVFSAIWSTSLAYISAMLYYQACTGTLSVGQFILLSTGCLLYLALLIYLLQRQIKADNKRRIPFSLKKNRNFN